MHALIELIAGFVAMLAAIALAQFGVDAGGPRHDDREVHRVSDCQNAAPAASASNPDALDC